MADLPTTQASLLVRLRNALDKDAWTQFVDVYAPVVYHFARGRGLQDADAADVTQTVLLHVARSIGNFHYDPGRGSFRGWLFTIVCNELRKYHEASFRGVRGTGDTGIQRLLESQPEEIQQRSLWEGTWQRQAFTWAADQVRTQCEERTWQAFWRTAIEGKAPKTVADELGMNVATIYVARGRVLARLKKLIEQVQDVGCSKSSQPTCPGRERFAQLLTEELSVAEQRGLQDHLEKCEQCQQTLEQLSASDPTLHDLSRHLQLLPANQQNWHLAGTGPALRKVLANLLSLDPEALVPEREPSMHPEPSLDFLEPSETPGSLGRMGGYEVLSLIGHGGMGVVLKALDPTLQRLVALKVLAPHLANRPVARQRFLREAQLSAAIIHENVVPLHAVVQGPGLPFLVMQYVEGISLQQRLDVSSVFAVPDVVRIGSQVARGLAAAHRRGVIHRDIKPANILLEENSRIVKITDFGLARAADDIGYTDTGVALGTPCFMSPEQAQGYALDVRSDLFSLGSVLYALCTGRPPFWGDRPLAIVRKVCEESPVPVREINPEVPGWLATLIGRLHARNPEERPASAAEVAEYLERGLAHLEQPDRVSPPGVKQQRPRRWGQALVAACVLCAGLVGLELAGITRLSPLAKILRASGGEGTLVVQVADDKIRVHLDDKELAITNLDGQEFRLPPGSYKLSAVKDGKLFKTEVVAIRGGERSRVRIALDPPVDNGHRNVAPEVGAPKLLEGHTGPVRSIVVTSDSKFAYSAAGWPGKDFTIRQWDLASRTEVRIVATLPDSVVQIVLSADDKRLLAACADGVARVFDVRSGKELSRFDEHVQGLVCAAWSKSGQVAASGDRDGMVFVWDPKTGKKSAGWKAHPDHYTQCLTFSPDEKTLLSGSRDGSACFWDLAGNLQKKIEPQRGWINWIKYTHDGTRLLVAENITTLWDAKTGETLVKYRGATAGNLQAELSPCRKYVLAASYDWGLRLYDAENGQLLQPLVEHQQIVWTAVFTPNGRYFLSGGGGINIGSAEQPNFVPGPEHAIRMWETSEVLKRKGK